MKILWVKTAGLVPPDTGGKIRSYNILRELAKHHSVTFFTFYAAHEGDIHSELRNVFDRVVYMPLDLPKAKSAAELRDYLVRACSFQPYNITKYSRAPVRKALLALLRGEDYDVIVCDFVFPSGVFPWDWPCAKVLFAHNVEAMIWKRHYQNARNPLWKLLSWREWLTMQRAERKYLRKADHVLTVSEADREKFESFLDPAKLTVIPTGVDSEYFKPSNAPETPASIVFTGSMDWLPNEDAIWYFTHDILPLIRRQIPNVSLCVVGRYPSPRLQALAAAESGVELTGWVDDIRPFLARSCVCIVPLRIGGGTRIKIYEAMAMGKPVVSTSIGAEGLPVSDQRDILLADDPAAFAQAVVDLLQDARRRREVGAAARDFVCKHCGWPQVTQALAAVLARVSRDHMEASRSSARPLPSARRQETHE